MGRLSLLADAGQENAEKDKSACKGYKPQSV